MASDPVCDKQPTKPKEEDLLVKVYLTVGPINCTCKLPNHHWALVFEFNDGAVRSLGIEEKKMRLEVHVKEDWPKNGTVSHLGEWKGTPKELLDMANSSKLNGRPYSLAESNCQRWVMELAKDGKLPQAIQDKLNKYCGFG